MRKIILLLSLALLLTVFGAASAQADLSASNTYFTHIPQSEWEKYLFTDDSYDSLEFLPDILGVRLSDGMEARHGTAIAERSGQGQYTVAIYFQSRSYYCQQLLRAIATNQEAYDSFSFILVDIQATDTPEEITAFLEQDALKLTDMEVFYKNGFTGSNALNLIAYQTAYSDLEADWANGQQINDIPFVFIFKGNGVSNDLRAIVNGPNAYAQNGLEIYRAIQMLENEYEPMLANERQPVFLMEDDDPDAPPGGDPDAPGGDPDAPGGDPDAPAGPDDPDDPADPGADIYNFPGFIPLMDADLMDAMMNDMFVPSGYLPATGFSTLRTERVIPRLKGMEFAWTGMDLMIPGLNVMESIVELPLEEGIYPVKSLESDLGLLEGSSLPGEGVAFIAGHNHLNKETAGPFVSLYTLDIGDKMVIRDRDGKLLVFSVYENLKIAAQDFKSLKEHLHVNALVLITCEDESTDGGYINRRVVLADLN